MTAVLKHELKSYFHSLTAYVFGAFLLVFVGIGAMIYNIQESVANFEYVLSFVSIVFVVIVPVLTMRVVAEEKKQKTDQLLYSLPITTTEVIVGKFLALLVVYMIPLCIIAFYPLIFAQFGEVYLLTAYGSLLAFCILGAALISVGIFISSLTENQGFAAGISFADSLPQTQPGRAGGIDGECLLCPAGGGHFAFAGLPPVLASVAGVFEHVGCLPFGVSP